MTAYERGFFVPNAFEVERNYGDMILACERVNARARKGGLTQPLVAVRRDLIRAAGEHRRVLNALAASTAADATAQIKDRLKATASRSRGPTGVSPHLASLIFSKPLIPNSGSVGIARTSTLNRSINPNTPGYGPYWRAQEYGTGSSEVVSQRGRVIVGFFYGQGGGGVGSRPSAAFRGGGGPHPVFIPGSVQPGPRGGRGGKGTIGREIQGRHFIRDGADAAATKWRNEMKLIEQRDSAAMFAITARLTGSRGRARPPRR